MTRIDSEAVFDCLSDSSATAQRVALCQIVRVEGASAGRLGWKLAVPEFGDPTGNLGGGAFEGMVLRDARDKLAEEIPGCEVKRYYFTEESTRGRATGMVCGGMAEVMIEVVGARPLLLICGGGPVGQAIASAGDLCGFDLRIVDDRSEFLAEDLFPDGAETIEVERDYAQNFLESDIDRELWVAFVTRCWETDLWALRSVLRQQPSRLCYLGMMGSRRKIARVEAALLEDGLDPKNLPAPLNAPIGLDIGGETPGEIAISVLAEIVEARRGRLAAAGTLEQRQPEEEARHAS